MDGAQLAMNDQPNASLDSCKDEVYRLYITENMILSKVMESLEHSHGITSTKAIYKAKLQGWGYHKNTSRQEVMTVLRQKQQHDPMKKPTVFFIRNRAVDHSKVAKFVKRRNIVHASQTSLFQPSQSSKRAAASNQDPVPRPLSTPPILAIPEKFLFHADAYVRGSFESTSWLSNGDEAIILSSQLQPLERNSLHSFIGGIDTGCTQFSYGDARTGGIYWRKAFREVDTLVQGSYHDILPNIMQKVNDLRRRGYNDAALMLMRYISESSRKHGRAGQITTSIFGTFASMDINHMQILEEAIMTHYIELFELYLGRHCYNSFVMRMNLAKRKIERGGVSELDKYLPDISELDSRYGISDQRPLDVIRTRVEILYEHKKYEEMLVQANNLVERATVIQNDQWKNLYFIIQGFYFCGIAEYYLKLYLISMQSLTSCLLWITEFEGIDDTSMFDPEKIEVLDKLEEMAGLVGDEESISVWRLQKAEMLKPVAIEDKGLAASIDAGTIGSKVS